MEKKKKSKLYIDGLDQGIRLQKEKQLENMRKVLTILCYSLSEEELEILSKILKEFENEM